MECLPVTKEFEGYARECVLRKTGKDNPSINSSSVTTWYLPGAIRGVTPPLSACWTFFCQPCVLAFWPVFCYRGWLAGRSQKRSSSAMCDFSLHHVKSRPAKVGDKLTTRNFNTGTRGFAAPEDSTTAVCILPGTELAFSDEVIYASRVYGWKTRTISSRTAIFRQINKDAPQVHHDALEFPDGTFVLLTYLHEGQQATVLQLPAQPKTPAEAKVQTRVMYVG